MAIPLGRPLPDASRDQPGRRAKTPVMAAGFPRPHARPYSVLLPVGFTVPRPSPAARCALTAPFHPYPLTVSGGAGGLLSVALSLGSPPPGVTRHRVSVEPGLSSLESAEAPRERPSDRLADVKLGVRRPGRKVRIGRRLRANCRLNPFDRFNGGLSECRSRAMAANCGKGGIGRADNAERPWAERLWTE